MGAAIRKLRLHWWLWWLDRAHAGGWPPRVYLWIVGRASKCVDYSDEAAVMRVEYEREVPF